MKFNYIEKINIPPLAWCACVRRDCDTVDVLHGKSVECKDDFFVAGVWDGVFMDGDFDSTHFSCCTGGSVNKSKSGVKFSTPNHLQDKIVSVLLSDVLYISNSVAFLLVVSECELDVNYPHYEEDFCNIIFGLHKAKTKTRLQDGKVLNMHFCCNVDVDNALTIIEEKKRSGLSFANFADYHTKVTQILEKLVSNATDKQRKIKYGMMSTISRGYDATFTSALVREVGCDKVLTFNRPEKYAPDCGTDIARLLGYENIEEGDGNLYLRNTGLLEAEACSSGEMGTAIAFAAFIDEYKDCLFFMGTRGDSLFERLHGNVNNDYDFSEGNGYTQSDSSFAESALRANSIIVHVPLIGGDRWSDLARISNSAEMTSYSVGESYDRPIARRIVEEAGVPREAFGQKKAGAGISFHFDTFARLRYKMSSVSYESLRAYKKKLKRNRWSATRYSIKYYAMELPVYLNYVCSKVRIPFRLSTQKCGKMSSPLSSLLILWGMDVMTQRYKQQLQ